MLLGCWILASCEKKPSPSDIRDQLGSEIYQLQNELIEITDLIAARPVDRSDDLAELKRQIMDDEAELLDVRNEIRETAERHAELEREFQTFRKENPLN